MEDTAPEGEQGQAEEHPGVALPVSHLRLDVIVHVDPLVVGVDALGQQLVLSSQCVL